MGDVVCIGMLAELAWLVRVSGSLTCCEQLRHLQLNGLCAVRAGRAVLLKQPQQHKRQLAERL